MACLGMMSSPASAQATRTWVSGVGDDVNPCSRTAPCKTFQGTISKTAAGGEISCIDPGGYGAVTITKSIAIICDYTEAGILTSGTSGVTVNAPGAVVYLSGLDFEGLGTSVNGINFFNGASLTVHNCTIRGYASAGTGNGISFIPSGGGTAKLTVLDSRLTDNSSTGATANILILPSGGTAVTASIKNTHLDNGRAGLLVQTAAGNSVNAVLADSVVSGNSAFGVGSVSPAAGGANAFVQIKNSSVSVNATGAIANGASAKIWVGSSVFTGNTTAAASTNNSGTVFTYQNNQIDGNTNDGTFTNATPH